MTEVNKRRCKICGEEKNRILAGKFPNGRDKKWAGDNGKLWNGNICGDCNLKRAKEIMVKIRAKN